MNEEIPKIDLNERETNETGRENPSGSILIPKIEPQEPEHVDVPQKEKTRRKIKIPKFLTILVIILLLV